MVYMQGAELAHQQALPTQGGQQMQQHGGIKTTAEADHNAVSLQQVGAAQQLP
jgi:hypothetical protein